MNKRTHLYHIDLLRIIAMFYVIILHTLGHGGIVAATARGSHQYMIACALEIWAYCAVDLFALISGYVAYREQPRPFEPKAFLLRYLRLWIVVLFYAFVPSAIACLLMPGRVSAREVLACLFPVTTGRYWYFSAYTGLFLLTPVLDAALTSPGTRFLKWFIGITVVIFSAYGSSMGRFSLGGGYSVLWLAILYICGGAVRKISIQRQESAGPEKRGAQSRRIMLFCAIGTAACTLLAWLWLMFDCHFTFFDAEVSRTAMMSYTALNVTAAALLHLVFFAAAAQKLPPAGKDSRRSAEAAPSGALPAAPHLKGQTGPKGRTEQSVRHRLLRAGGESAFAVYLINTQPVLWKFSKDRFAALGTAHTWQVAACTVGYSILFLIGAGLIDRVRLLLLGIIKRTAISAAKSGQK